MAEDALKSLKELREARGMTREELADAVNEHLVRECLSVFADWLANPGEYALADFVRQAYESYPDNSLAAMRDAVRRVLADQGVENPSADKVEGFVKGVMYEEVKEQRAKAAEAVRSLVGQLDADTPEAKAVGSSLHLLLREEGVSPEKISRWEEVGVDYIGSAGADALFNEGATRALVEVLKPGKGGIVWAGRPGLHPGDVVVRREAPAAPVDIEAEESAKEAIKEYARPFLEKGEGEERFYVLPDGVGGVYLKPGNEVTFADIKALGDWFHEEAQYNVAMEDFVQGQLNKLTTLGAKDGVEAEEIIRREVEKLEENLLESGEEDEEE